MTSLAKRAIPVIRTLPNVFFKPISFSPPFRMCERHQTEMTYKNSTATPKHKVTKWIPVPCATNCGNWLDKENMGSSTNKTPGTICPKC
ncbi:uncharacterized protein EKO05_0003225 [Ascochyta rabiei]|uniref:uncharacterized protein n=1 Tax=Didymella rabiei TaxID=5454 RepID=UPI00220538C2|nr:uncharacterized protein EKO05_0003225 [Ascochyta rabiei]UPX12685.1 hypothetical protein EKO05_0003225 [Ascochyta rabiei]